jgi:hypothetical protein
MTDKKMILDKSKENLEFLYTFAAIKHEFK